MSTTRSKAKSISRVNSIKDSKDVEHDSEQTQLPEGFSQEMSQMKAISDKFGDEKEDSEEFDEFRAYKVYVPGILLRQAQSALESLHLSRERLTSLATRFYGAFLCIDISGFTDLLKEKGLDIIQKIKNYFSQLVAIIHKHHGDVVKFTGDGLQVIWQCPVSTMSYTHDGKIPYQFIVLY
jgi:hypothetical protein